MAADGPDWHYHINTAAPRDRVVRMTEAEPGMESLPCVTGHAGFGVSRAVV